MDVLQRPVGLIADGVEDIEMRDIGGQSYGEDTAGFGLLAPGSRLPHQPSYQHYEHEPATIARPLHWCLSCMASCVLMNVKKPGMDAAPPVRRGLGAGQQLRSPQEASSSLETGQQGQHGRAGNVGIRHKRTPGQSYIPQVSR